MVDKYLLQQYDNGTFGYKGIDDCPDELQLKNRGFGEGRGILAEQGENESREEFITRAGISFTKDQYGSNENKDRNVNDEDFIVRLRLAILNYGLDKLVTDKEWDVRRSVADQGYGLDKLVNDERCEVREAVAYQGYGLNKLVNDEHYWVRQAVAEQGYGLDKLVKDKSWRVRQIVADQGYRLDELVNDEEPKVREAVAKQGYGLDKLFNDKEHEVHACVDSYLNTEGLTLKEWKIKYPERCVLGTKNKIDKDIIYRNIDTSEKLKIEENNDFEGFSIITVDTKVPIITFEKEDDDYIFLVDIRDKDELKYKTKIKTASDLNKAIDFIINVFEESPIFSKYIDDIEALKQ